MLADATWDWMQGGGGGRRAGKQGGCHREKVGRRLLWTAALVVSILMEDWQGRGKGAWLAEAVRSLPPTPPHLRVPLACANFALESCLATIPPSPQPPQHPTAPPITQRRDRAASSKKGRTALPSSSPDSRRDNLVIHAATAPFPSIHPGLQVRHVKIEYRQDWSTNFVPRQGGVWNQLGTGRGSEKERTFSNDNLLVRMHLIIKMILVDWPCAMRG